MTWTSRFVWLVGFLLFRHLEARQVCNTLPSHCLAYMVRKQKHRQTGLAFPRLVS